MAAAANKGGNEAEKQYPCPDSLLIIINIYFLYLFYI